MTALRVDPSTVVMLVAAAIGVVLLIREYRWNHKRDQQDELERQRKVSAAVIRASDNAAIERFAAVRANDERLETIYSTNPSLAEAAKLSPAEVDRVISKLKEPTVKPAPYAPEGGAKPIKNTATPRNAKTNAANKVPKKAKHSKPRGMA